MGSDMEGKKSRKTESRASGSSGAEWSGKVRTSGHEGNLDNILHRTESSDWVADFLGFEKPPNDEHDIWSL